MPDLVLYNEESCNKEWIVDSGSSHHDTGNASLLLEVRQHKEERVIITADDSTHPVEKEGVIKIKVGDERALKLEDVYHVTGLKINLVSVPQITASGKYVLFGPSDVKILDNVRNLAANVIVTGKKKGSLFVLSADEAYVKKTSQNDSAAIWHARLGHIGYQLLQQISSKRLLEGIPVLQHVREDVICQGCQFGKSHRLPCQKSVNRKSTMFELVHTDLMGSMKPSSYSGYCNGMVLVDDCSKYTWVKFLKEK
ncbi:retrovirus-related pol polyprotein from transposon TNT 1-94, partial [Tanacetum coccineum]